MNSMFSSFDALCAELLGKKVGDSLSFYSTKAVNGGGNGVVGEKVLSKATDSASKNTPSQQKAPRFAPELDGLHCFETIVRY